MASKITIFSVIMLVCIMQSQCCRIKREGEEETKKPEEESAKPAEGSKNPLGGITDKFPGKLPDSFMNSISSMMKEVGPKEVINIFKQFIKT